MTHLLAAGTLYSTISPALARTWMRTGMNFAGPATAVHLPTAFGRSVCPKCGHLFGSERGQGQGNGEGQGEAAAGPRIVTGRPSARASAKRKAKAKAAEAEGAAGTGVQAPPARRDAGAVMYHGKRARGHGMHVKTVCVVCSTAHCFATPRKRSRRQPGVAANTPGHPRAQARVATPHSGRGGKGAWDSGGGRTPSVKGTPQHTPASALSAASGKRGKGKGKGKGRGKSPASTPKAQEGFQLMDFLSSL